jgi:hypothetical protein
MALLNVTQYARHRGCRKAAVEFALERGRIQKNADGLIDSEQADRDWEANTDHRQARPGPKPPKTSHRKPVESAPPLEERQALQTEIASGGTLNFANARALRELYAAELLRLDYETKQATLMPRSQVEGATFDVYRVVRDGLLNIPDRIAAQLAVETNSAVVRDLLTREITQALEALSTRLAEEPAA